MNTPRYFFLALFLLVILPVKADEATTLKVNRILEMEVQSSINPATLNYLRSGQAEAQKQGMNLIIVKLSTPGGLVTTTKDILTLIGDSEIPWAIWVTPEGASATSAGAIIGSGAHFLFMSEGTNIGAATPITMSGDIDGEKKELIKDPASKDKKKEIEGSDGRKKAINDLVALVQSLSESRGRNGQFFGEMIADAKSFKAREAVEKNLVNGIANSKDDILRALNGKTVVIKGQSKKIELGTPEFIEFAMDAGQKLLNIFANPSLAYILFIMGAALIYFELQAPGGFIAGAIGAVCLILSGIGFQVLPLNFGALGLLVLSFTLFLLEVYVTSFGLLTLAGLAALIFGSLFLFRTDDSYIHMSTSVVISAVSAVAAFTLFITFYLIKNMRQKVSSDFNSIVGKSGTITEELSAKNDGKFYYQLKIAGEYWQAEAETKRNIGEVCVILGRSDESMTLKI